MYLTNKTITIIQQKSRNCLKLSNSKTSDNIGQYFYKIKSYLFREMIEENLSE